MRKSAAAKVHTPRDIYGPVVNDIISALEKGVLPWEQPWAETPGARLPALAS